VDTLTNVGSAYDAIPASKGLGMAIFDFTGVTSLTLAVWVNKIGTGTQSWQVWNHTDSAQIGVIDDAGAAGDKLLQQTFAVALTGTKVVRVRAKSTVAADDPILYSAAFRLV
jgi:hypothetical protein